jgi:hypothetical protein
LPPFSEKAQDPVAPRETNGISAAKAAAQASSAYLNYATDTDRKLGQQLPKIRQERSIDPDFAAAHQPHVRLRSKSVTVQPVVNPTGSISYRVMGTIRPKAPQRKKHFLNPEDALATQAAWESERIMNGAAVRPKITRLTQAELAQAEAAVEMLKGTGITIIEATRFFLRQPAPTPASLVSRKVIDAHGEFLAERRPFVGNCQYENLRLAGENFFAFIGTDTLLADVTSKQVVAWLKSKGEIKKKTWNNYRNDLSTFFEWCVASPRRWIADNPVKEVPQHEILAALPERLAIDTARALMADIETTYSEWSLFFALSLFAGIRPDMANGEIFKLAAAVGRNGAEKYFCNGVVHITAEIAKDKRPRQTILPANLLQWIDRYSVTPTAICPGHWPTYGAIREKFQIPHDGLRHTAISAFVSRHGSFADAAMQFGNSESMIRTHYFNRMTKAEAEAFYAILPAA